MQKIDRWHEIDRPCSYYFLQIAFLQSQYFICRQVLMTIEGVKDIIDFLQKCLKSAIILKIKGLRIGQQYRTLFDTGKNIKKKSQKPSLFETFFYLTERFTNLK